MGEGSPRSFSAILATQRAEFISYREAMKKLREFSGERLNDVAAGLKLHGVHEKHLAYLSGSEQAVKRVTYAGDLTALLDETIGEGGITPAWIGPDDQADPDRCGWIRLEFVAALREAALPCPDTLLASGEHASSTRQDPALPDWVSTYKGRNEISLGDAAALLANCGPVPLPKNMEWTAEGKAKIASWRATLIDAIGRDFDERLDFRPEIVASGWNTNRDAEQMLSHADIRAWCAKRGHAWPVPELDPKPAQSTESLTEIYRLTAEVARLSQRLAGKNQEISRLEKALVRNSVQAAAHQDRLEKQLSAEQHESTDIVAEEPTANGIEVCLPHLPKRLDALFTIMREQWTGYQKDRAPKSTNIASAIDKELGYKSQRNGEPSRNAQTLASLIRPDEEREADSRVNKRIATVFPDGSSRRYDGFPRHLHAALRCNPSQLPPNRAKELQWVPQQVHKQSPALLSLTLKHSPPTATPAGTR